MKKSSSEIAFLVFGLLILLVGLVLFSRYIQVLFLAFLSCVLLFPTFRNIRKKSSLPNWVLVTIVLLLALIIIVLPLTYLTIEIVSHLSKLDYGPTNEYLVVIVDRSNEVLSFLKLDDLALSIDEITSYLSELGRSANSDLFSFVIDITTFSIDFITKTFIFLLFMYWVLPNYEKTIKKLMKLSPLDFKVTKLYLERFQYVINDLFKGTFIIALVQGLLTGLIFALLGIGNVFFFTLAAIVVSIIPLIGTSLIIIPVCLYYIFIGDWLRAIILIAWQVIVLTNIDNIIRPYVFREEIQPPPILALIAMLAGTAMFGFLGIIYGPIILVLLFTTLEVYQKFYLKESKTKLSIIENYHLPISEGQINLELIRNIFANFKNNVKQKTPW